jgi:hypothetical protein
MSLALNIYATTTGLGWPNAASYGFKQGFGGLGLGQIYYNVGTNGASFGVANNTFMLVSDILAYVNSKTTRVGGSTTTLPTWTMYGGNATLINGANNVMNGINQMGDII